jgi:hypothetical protein
VFVFFLASMEASLFDIFLTSSEAPLFVFGGVSVRLLLVGAFGDVFDRLRSVGFHHQFTKVSSPFATTSHFSRVPKSLRAENTS